VLKAPTVGGDLTNFESQFAYPELIEVPLSN